MTVSLLPLIKPDVRFYRIRLSDDGSSHRFCVPGHFIQPARVGRRKRPKRS